MMGSACNEYSGGEILTALHVTCKTKSRDNMRVHKILSCVRRGPGCPYRSVCVFCLVYIVSWSWQ